MAQDMYNHDLINLDEATKAPPDSGAGASSGDSVIHAAEMFQQQLDQMTAWKTQLSQQMEAMRGDAVKLMERQKFLAQEKTRLAEERTKLTEEQTQLQQQQAQLATASQELAQRATELDATQSRLAELAHQRDIAQLELAAREKALADREAHHLSESVRLRESVEQLEEHRRQFAIAQQQAVHQREQLEAQSMELAARAQALEQQDHSLATREMALANTKNQLEKAQSDLQSQQAALAAQEKVNAEKLRAAESQLEARTAALVAGERHIAAEREGLASLRSDLQKRVEAFEQEQAEQLETLSKQTKRLSERRATIEAAEKDLDAALADRIAEATEPLKAQLAQAQAAGGGNQERLTQLEHQLAQLEQQRTQLEQQRTHLDQQRIQLEQQLAQLQQKLNENQNAAANSQTHEQQLQSQLDSLQKSHDDLAFQLELAREELPKQLETLRQQLTQEIAQRDAQIATWQQKFQAAQTAASSRPTAPNPQDAARINELSNQVEMFQLQRDDLAAQLFALQNLQRKQQEESVLARDALESKLHELHQRNSTLEAEKSTWKQSLQATTDQTDPADVAAALKQSQYQRQRLLKQARALRTFRGQIRESQSALSVSRSELAQHREQLRARKENLEQVKRLLEKQEMVMARKLADHNAIKTVAAVGIFVIMVLGSVFFGVYHFVKPIYRSEAVVQLAAPQNVQPPQLDSWLKQQMEFVRSSDVTYAAWNILRSADEHYAMHDVRDEWLATLPSHLHLTLDAGSKTLTVQYTGADPQGVSQVCNALATAYTTPGMREPTAAESTRTLGTGSQLLAKAAAPLFPVEDNRMMISMSIVAVVMFVSLLLVMIFRHFIARQLKEIDQMADAADLQDIQSDLPDGVGGAHPAT